MHKVLIIEDTVELAEVIQATLERMSIKSYHETHGNKAFDIYKEIKPDLVLLDIALPDIKGWKLLDKIREEVEADSEQKMPQVVVITAYGDPANRLMGKLQDVNRYLVKPFTPDEVERVVSIALGLRKPDEKDLPAMDVDPLIEVMRLIEGPTAELDATKPARTSIVEAETKPSKGAAEAIKASLEAQKTAKKKEKVESSEAKDEAKPPAETNSEASSKDEAK